jgi:hypothetical protein
MGEEARIKRPYRPRTACPFVEASVRNNALFMGVHSEITGEEVEPIVKVLLDYIKPFIISRNSRASIMQTKLSLLYFLDWFLQTTILWMLFSS